MLPPREGGVINWQVLENLDVAGQADADVCALDQVVTKQRLGRKSSSEHRMKRAHIVDRFAVKNAFEEQILLRVGHHAVVGVGAARVGEDTREMRGGGPRQSNAYPGLNDGVTAHSHA